MTPSELQLYLSQINLPRPDSHKGQNGKVMVIGGSELFHAASQWSLLVVSRMVDMVFYSSVPENNDLIKESKEHFHNGIVVPRENVEDYIQEADVVLIGPGMVRNDETEKITTHLLSKYPNEKWVIDAGALQMIDPKLFTNKTIITPHHQEYAWLLEKVGRKNTEGYPFAELSEHPTILLKGKVDEVFNAEQKILVEGGNEGMTKGGTGDVLAGLVAGLYAFTDNPFAAAVVASYVNKHAGDELYKTVGPFFNSTDLANQIPKTLAKTFAIV
ncbi:MAG: NAD(P)H-hydrate dehydratase [Patescibacteria group bacterium]